MEAILLGIYSFFVWLIFIKKKWLPWNTTSQVIVVIIPVVGWIIYLYFMIARGTPGPNRFGPPTP